MKKICKALSIVLIIAVILPTMFTQATTVADHLISADYDAPLVIQAPLAEGIEDTPNSLISLISTPIQNCPRSTPLGFDLNGIHYDFATYVKTQGQQDVAAFTATSDFTANQVASITANYQQAFPGIIILDDPTSSYNCHSYAWHDRSTSNPYWISDVESYINDVHTYALTKNDEPQIDDILVYYNENGPQHSAVIIGESNGRHICVSKWGASILCEHFYDYVPLEYARADKSVFCIAYRVQPHNWYSYTNHNTGTHTRYCSLCNYFESARCNLIGVSAGASGHYQRCTLCGYQTSTTTSHNYAYRVSSSGKHIKYCKDCGYETSAISCTVKYSYCGDNASSHQHKQVCYYCGQTLSVGIDCSFAYAYYGVENGIHKHILTCTSCGHQKGLPAMCHYKNGSNICNICGWNKNQLLSVNPEYELE